jgi:uncharacterized protein YjbI with pentapeptide repeats/predicted RNA-binding Zn-ribbon protein involved in translation (DUF1610 family)
MTSEILPHIGSARDWMEVRYWLALHGCPQCGERSIGTPGSWRYHGAAGNEMERVDVTCPNCGHQRSIRFNILSSYDYPFESVPHGHLGGRAPSQIISPHLFAKELARCLAELAPRTRADNIHTLEKIRSYPYEWKPLRNGETSSAELAKFLPDGADAVPSDVFLTDEARAYRAAHPEQFTRSFIEHALGYFDRIGRDTRAESMYMSMAEPCGWPVLKELALPDARTAALELARCMHGLRADLRTLTLDELGHNNELWCTARRAARYLQDLIPEGALSSDADRAYQREHPRAFERAYLDDVIAQLDRVCLAHDHEYQWRWTDPRYRMPDAPRDPNPQTWTPAPRADPPGHKPGPLPPFSLAALAFHERWAEHGDGEKRQRMIAVGADARERNLSGRNLARVSLAKVTLDRASLARTQLYAADLTDVSARASDWTGAGLAESSLQRCNFADSAMAHASFFKAEVAHSTFTAADLTAARLDEAAFTDCDLRGAKLGIAPGGDVRIADATFIRCDLRDTNWSGRILVRVQLIDCKLAGAHGVTSFDERVVVRPDLSPAGDGSLVVDEHTAAQRLSAHNPEERP